MPVGDICFGNLCEFCLIVILEKLSFAAALGLIAKTNIARRPASSLAHVADKDWHSAELLGPSRDNHLAMRLTSLLEAERADSPLLKFSFRLGPAPDKVRNIYFRAVIQRHNLPAFRTLKLL